MKGLVDGGGRALLEIELKPAEDDAATTVSAWIDTGFTGDLVLPGEIIDSLGLCLSGTVGAVLADGSQVAMRTYTCVVRWFDGWQHLAVVSSNAEFPLLGVGLLFDHELTIDYRSCEVTLD